MSKALRTTFLVHVFVVVVFGLPLLLVPKTYESMMRWNPLDPTITRFLGAVLVALGVSSWMGYKAVSWDQVRIVVVQEIVFTILATVVGLYEALFGSAPVAVWLNIAVVAVFALLWISFYRQHSN